MQSFRTLAPHFRPYRWHMLVVIISSLTVTAMSLVQPWIIRDLIRIVNAGGGQLNQSIIAYLVVALALSSGLRALGQYLKDYIAHVMAWRFVSDIQGAVYSHLQSLSLSFYANRQTGELMSRVTSDTRDIEPIIAHSIPDFIVYSLMIGGICVVLFTLNPLLTLLVVVPMPLLIYLVLRLVHGEHNGFMRALKQLGLFHAKVQDNLSGIKEIQIFAQERRESETVTRLAKNATAERLYALKMQALVPCTIELGAGLGTILIVWFGGGLALAGQMNIEDLVAFILYLGILYQPIRVLAYTNEGLQTGLAGAKRVAELLQLQPDVADPPDGIEPQTVRGEVTFERVRFHYLPQIPVLKDITVSVKPGQILALVGPTGAGKSTLASLVARFYDPADGRMLIDGVDVRGYRLSALRRHISMVSQDVFLFNGTVRDNIRFGRPDATDAQVEEAARLAHAEEFIRELPNGYDTEIGERGVKLSGGQKQRIAIARALLKDAPILILDEATSAVDTHTEALIQQALARLMKGRTAIVIAHRLSTVQRADIIAVLDKGRVIEMGQHDDLLQRDGLYRQLYEQQFKVAG